MSPGYLSMSPGYLALMLHAHLPYVRHPEHEHFLEEDWLYEAITETYIPLLQACEAMAADGRPLPPDPLHEPAAAAACSPTTCCGGATGPTCWPLRELVGKELARNADDGHLLYLARHYEQQRGGRDPHLAAARW